MRVPAIAALALCVTALPAAAQPFSTAKSSQAGYAIATVTPQRSCVSLSSFKGEGLRRFRRASWPRPPTRRSTVALTGVIAPEVAFEVNLPERWNQRFYMTGNGGLAGDPVDTPTNADRTGGLTSGFTKRAL